MTFRRWRPLLREIDSPRFPFVAGGFDMSAESEALSCLTPTDGVTYLLKPAVPRYHSVPRMYVRAGCATIRLHRGPPKLNQRNDVQQNR
jgi:hypothetical protein